MRFLSLTTLAAAIAASFLGGCKDHPVDSPPAGDTSRVSPGVGSTFTFTVTSFDGAGKPTAVNTLKLTASRSGVASYGRSNVVVYALTPPVLFLDSLAFAHSQNGDLEIPYHWYLGYDDVAFSPAVSWSPIGTTNTERDRVYVDYDSTINVRGVNTHVSVKRLGGYDGAEGILVAGQTLATVRCVYRQDATVRGYETADEQNADSTWYAPSIGMIVRWSSSSYKNRDQSITRSSERWDLTGYTLK